MFKKKIKIRHYQIEQIDDTAYVIPSESPLIRNSTGFNFHDSDFSNINKIVLDLNGVIEYDSYLILLIIKLRRIAKMINAEFELENLTTSLSNYLRIIHSSDEVESNKENVSWIVRYFNNVGMIIIRMFGELYSFISFLGMVIFKLIASLVKPTKIRWVDFPELFTRNGVMALPITLLILFLIGLISGYQGALQLKQFGADTFIADLVGISLTRELSPLMVAILVAGRSGSAFAAQLGTMKVSDEIDALESMGFDTYNFLVIPRILSVTLAMPILVLICNVVGVTGGLIAALSTLDITIIGYINRLQVAISYGDIISGLIKSVVFGFIIATIGCYKGLSTSGGADNVGKTTTSSVVSSVFMIILIDAVFTFLLSALGI